MEFPPPTWSQKGTGGGKSAAGLTWTSMGSVQEEPLRQDCGVASALVFSKRSCFGNETIAQAAAEKWIWRNNHGFVYENINFWSCVIGRLQR